MASADEYEREYANHELLAMDDDEARHRLSVAQYERREKLQDLHEEADETREQWAEEQQEVAEITVSADPEQLGTTVDVFGNDLLVRIDSEDPALQRAADSLDDIRAEYADVDAEAMDQIPRDDREAMGNCLVEMLDAVIVRWDGTEWADLPDWKREAVLADARTDWGLDGLLLAWVDIAAAVNDDREERLDVVESFRGSSGRGRR